MPEPTIPQTDWVLIGAGHTNLHVVRQWRMQPVPGVRLTVVSPHSRAPYSGMLPGTLAGLYSPDQMHVDLRRFTAGTGIRLIVAEAIGLDPQTHEIRLRDRPPLHFDIAAVGIGSVPGQAALRQKSPRILSIKPMATFQSRLEAQLAICPATPLRCVIAGGGAAGTEIAFCLDRWLRPRLQNLTQRHTVSQQPYQLTLIDGHDQVLPGYVPWLRKRAAQLLAERRIDVLMGCTVTDVVDRAEQEVSLCLSNGDVLDADLVIWATAAAPPPVLAEFALPKSADGFLEVQATLQSTAGVPVFAVGDTASLVGQRVPKAGVYAVREGPVLWQNLQRLHAGQKLVEFQPQRGFLSLLSTGDSRALLQYGGWSTYGYWPWKLKDHIDRKFMAMYQDYTPPRQMTIREAQVPAFRPPVSGGSSLAAGMWCQGCGSKVGAEILHEALVRLRTFYPDVTEALARLDDAFILPPSRSTQLLSVDFFPNCVDDPYWMGRIAAVHALSDVWAMGGQPSGVQVLITLPHTAATLQTAQLVQLLAGVACELSRAGCQLWGGHTIEGAEPQIGLSVVGHLGDCAPWRKSGVVAGDRLILTKPLGSGTLLAANRLGRCRAEWFDRLLEHLVQSNQAAASSARSFSIHAATDVTGFGLGGHLLELLADPHCGAVLSPKAVGSLALPGFTELTREGIASSLAPTNLARLQAACTIPGNVATPNRAGVPGAFPPGLSDAAALTMALMVDPQTCGGLLLAVADEHAQPLIQSLRDAGCINATEIGRIVARSEGTPQIRFEETP